MEEAVRSKTRSTAGDSEHSGVVVFVVWRQAESEEVREQVRPSPMPTELYRHCAFPCQLNKISDFANRWVSRARKGGIRTDTYIQNSLNYRFEDTYGFETPAAHHANHGTHRSQEESKSRLMGRAYRQTSASAWAPGYGLLQVATRAPSSCLGRALVDDLRAHW